MYEDLWRAGVYVMKRYHQDAILYFFRLLTDLPNFLARVDERAEVQSAGLRLETRLTFRLTRGKSATILVPILQIAKQSSIDGLEIVDAQDCAIPALSAYEVRGLLAIALDGIVACALEQAPDRDIDALFPRRSVEELKRLICRPLPYVDAELADRIKNVLKSLHLTDDWMERIERFCLGLGLSRLVVVEIDRPRALNVMLTYRQVIGHRHAARKLWRTVLGLAPDNLDTPQLIYATRAQSYHFQLLAGSGRYIHHAALEYEGRPPHGRAREKDDKTGPVFVRYDGDTARSYAHYSVSPMREPRNRPDVPSQPARDYWLDVKLREVPPGALGGATLISLATAVMTTFFALFDAAGPARPDSADIPALLIALPAFTAILVGHWSDASILPKSSVSAYCGLLGTMVISLASALVFLLDSAGLLSGADVQMKICCGGGAISTNWLWIELAALACTQTLYLLLRLHQNALFFVRLQKIPVGTQPGQAPVGQVRAGHRDAPADRVISR